MVHATISSFDDNYCVAQLTWGREGSRTLTSISGGSRHWRSVRSLPWATADYFLADGSNGEALGVGDR
jgi:hypothetical protein